MLDTHADRLVYFMICIFAIMIFIPVIGWISAENEIVECRKWQEMASKYEGFYLVQWQRDQCDFRGVVVNAITK